MLNKKMAAEILMLLGAFAALVACWIALPLPLPTAKASGASKLDLVVEGIAAAGEEECHVAWASRLADGSCVKRELKLSQKQVSKLCVGVTWWPLQEDCETMKNCPQVITRVIGFGKLGEDGVWRSSGWLGAEWPNECGTPFDCLVIADEVPSSEIEICPIPVDTEDNDW